MSHDLQQVLARMVTRVCACGCGNTFKVLPESTHLHASERCAVKCGWQRPNDLYEQNVFRVTRRWYEGIPTDPDGIMAS